MKRASGQQVSRRTHDGSIWRDRFWRTCCWVTAVLLAALLYLGLDASPAAAHAVPVLSNPQPNAVLDEAPAEITIRFNEPVVPALSQITLLTQAGQQVETGSLTVADTENRTLTVAMTSLNEGSYLVSWQVLSAVDGHTTTGTFSFGVGATAVTAATAETIISARLSPLSAAARWLNLTGLAIVLGLFAFRLLVLNPIFVLVELEPEEEAIDLQHARSGRRIALAGLGLLATAVLFILIDQGRNFNLLVWSNLRAWLGTQFGTIWLARLLLLVLLALLIGRFLRMREREELRGVIWWLGLLLAAAYGLTASLVSHSAALPLDTAEAVAVDFVHVLAATIWVGGLLYLALLVGQARPLPPESRTWLNLSLALHFSAVAAVSVGLLLVSGGYLAQQHVGSWTALVGTAYGLALLTKLGLALPVLLIAGLNLFVFKPRLQRAYDEEEDTPLSAGLLRRFRLLLLAETVVALLILAAAGILTDLQRGADAPLLADAPGRTTVTQQAEDLDVSLTIEPALVGNNTFDVLLLDATGEPVDDASEVLLRYTFLGQSLGATDGAAEPVGNGRYRIEGSYISLIGTWQVEVIIRRPGIFDTFAPYRLEAGLGGNIREVESGQRPLERFARFMELAGGGATGAFLLLFALGWGVIGAKAARREWQLVPLLLISIVTFWLGGNQLFVFFSEEYTPARFATNPILPDAQSIAVGQTLFQENCVRCHGENGRGNGPAAAGLAVPPANFAAGHTATHTDGDLYYWIREGIDGAPMPAFGADLTPDETWHLVNYVRRLSNQSG